MRALISAAHTQSDEELAEAEYLRKARNYALYANPGEVSPIIGWTLSERWTNAEHFPGAPRGERTAKGSQDALFLKECSGEIDASH